MKRIDINIGRQTLVLRDENHVVGRWLVSTATNGAGEQRDSYQTPRGRHLIRAKIGAMSPINTIFRGRRPTGEFFSPQLMEQHPDRDWILTRILWLSGCDIGKNRLGCVDTMQRYIYIHGTPSTTVLGQPGSRGCIRMANADIIHLFDWVPVHTPVHIVE